MFIFRYPKYFQISEIVISDIWNSFFKYLKLMCQYSDITNSFSDIQNNFFWYLKKRINVNSACHMSAVSYSSFIVTMAVSVTVCELFSVKEWCDLENTIRVRSRSLELALFERLHTIFYSPFIVTMALSCIVCEI